MAMRFLLLGAAAASIVAADAEASSVLVPHQAVYDLALASQDAGIVDAEGRIAMNIRSRACEAWDLDYRFVARFRQDQEVTLTDQQTVSTESRVGDVFDFTTKTFVDGSPEKEVKGVARQAAEGTKVTMQSPERKNYVLPSARFPMQHTEELIRRAKAGDRIVESKLFDGDDDAEKLLTSTAIIAAVETPAAGATAGAGAASAVKAKLAGMRAWRISESYYNTDSDDDGMPVFQTSYVLYENGVSDELVLDFGTYSFKGTLRQLDILAAPDCR